MSISLWSEHSCVKILSDKNYVNRKDCIIAIEAAKGEHESTQLIITPDKDIVSYTIAVRDIKSAKGDILSKSAFTVYNQKYIHVTEPSPKEPDQTPGWYPDALLPFETAVKYNENTAAAGRNQGIWVSVNIPYTQSAGIYEGEFALIIDGELYEIPVKVTVWDFELNKKSHFQSDFVVGSDGLFAGEYDYSQHMYRKYVEKLIEFKLSPHRIIQYLNVPYVEPSDFIDELRYLTAEGKPEMSTLMIPVFPTDNKGINEPHFEGIVLALADACVEDKINYFDDAAVYCGFIDEPHLNGNYDQTNAVCRQFEDAKNRIADKFLARAKKNAETAAIAEGIRKIPNYVTTFFDEKLPDIKNYCVHVSRLKDADERAKYREVSKPLWGYTCGASHVPVYSLDHKALDLRVIGWMGMDYGFCGFLYWDTVVYTKGIWNQTLHVNQKIFIDTYKEPVRCSKDNGDGFLFYPGRPYGIYGPVESVRLHLIRDGVEDYEYLYIYKELCQKAGIDSNILLRPLYDSMYTDVIVKNEPENFVQARRKLANAIVELKKTLKK